MLYSKENAILSPVRAIFHDLGYDSATGKRIIKNVLGKTQAEVKEKLARAMESIKDLDVARMDDYTVDTWLTSWYNLYAKPNVRVSTAEYYCRSI